MHESKKLELALNKFGFFLFCFCCCLLLFHLDVALKSICHGFWWYICYNVQPFILFISRTKHLLFIFFTFMFFSYILIWNMVVCDGSYNFIVLDSSTFSYIVFADRKMNKKIEQSISSSQTYAF